MNVLVSVDMEGITGVTGPQDTTPDTPGWSRFRTIMTRDVNAAVAGAIDAGAASVLVTEAHNGYRSVLLEELDNRALLLSGRLRTYGMLEGIDRNIDMVLFVGYHAPAGSAGVLSHTFYASALTDMRVNGRRCSESLFNALLAGSYGVGVGMISGDDIACQDAREVIPGIETVEVKRAVDRFTAICIPPGRTEQMIRTGAAAAVRNPSAHPPIRIEPPLIWETHWVGTNSVTMGSWVPGVQVVDPHTLRWVSGDMESSMRMWNTVATMAGAALEGRFM